MQSSAMNRVLAGPSRCWSRPRIRGFYSVAAIIWCVGQAPPARASALGTHICRLALVPGVRLAHLRVAQFGARGNGIADDTAAVQAALDSVPDSGGAVFIPPSASSYRVATIRPKSATILWGGGTIDVIDDGSRAGRSIFVDRVHDLIVYGLTIKSSNATRRSGVYGNIRINEASRVAVVRCRLGRSSSVAIHTINSSDLVFNDNEVFGTFADGIHVSRGGGHVHIIDNDIHNTGDDAIGVIGYLDAGRDYPPIVDVSIQLNHIRDAGSGIAGNGIDVQGVTGAVISGNQIDGARLSGIFVGATAGNASGLATHYVLHARVNDNDIAHVGLALPGRGITVHGASNVSVRNNHIDFTSSDGILVDHAGADIEIVSNRITNVAMRGINWIQGSSTDPRLVAEMKDASPPYGSSRVGLHRGLISRNSISDIGSDGINVAGESTLHVQSVVIRDNAIVNVARASAGIVAYRADDVVIMKNYISHTETPIEISTSNRCVVVGNVSDAVGTDAAQVR